MKPSILIVEDDEIIQLDLQMHLQELEYAVVGAVSSGEEAIAKATALRPDVVLMDIRLRGALNGIEAAQSIRSTLAIPVIYLTAQSGEQLKGRGVEVLEPRVTKPFNQKMLQAAIEQALGRKSS